uniref:PaaI family thioesterase n=1 Tax=Archaeoglobus fulgidus TaxID=2234 RepID=A0A7J2TKI6_ARCFL
MESIEKFIEKVESAPWYRLLGMKIELGERISVILNIEEKHMQALGIAHGGVTASILDSAIGLNINRDLIPKGKLAVTSQLNVHYLKPVQKGVVRATARPLYIGSKVAVGFGELKDERGETLAVATATFYIRDL